MNDLALLKQQLADYIAAGEHFGQVRVLCAFPSSPRDFPLTAPAVAVGIDRVEAAAGGLGRFWGDSGAAALLGSRAQITVRLDLYAPLSAGGGGVQELYEALCARLMMEPAPFGCEKLWCGGTEYDKSASAYRLTAFLSLSAALVRSEEGALIQDFLLVSPAAQPSTVKE